MFKKNITVVLLSTLLCFIISCFLSYKSEAATYSFSTGCHYVPNSSNPLAYMQVTVTGRNVTQGIEMQLPAIAGLDYDHDNRTYCWLVTYIVPDDGCTWNITGSIMAGCWNGASSAYGTMSATVTTSGNFTGPSAGTATDAANNGASYAANSQAAAQNAYNAANSANSYAQQANTNASNASTRSWYSGKYGGIQQSVADVAGYMANNQLPGINSKIDSLSTAINNLSGEDKTPPAVSLKTVSGAMATSGSSIRAVLEVTDPDGTAFTYSLDSINYLPVPANKIINLPVSIPGPNAILVWVKDQAGNVGSTSIIIRKL